MNVLDLFSGIGGFSLGLERAGMRTVAFCEIDPYCQRVLAKHWPGVPVYPDVRELSGQRLWDEYRKIKYMGDCKCGKCQLIPMDVIDEKILQFDRLQDLVKTLIENDPDEPVADNGATVLDVWRDRAKRVLAAVSRSSMPTESGGE